MKHHLQFVKKIISNGGPEPSEYKVFQDWLHKLSAEIQAEILDRNDLQIIRDAFGDAVSEKTIQGFILQKPYGYSGDFQIIEKIYRKEISQDPNLSKWDHFAQSQKACIALRNRKQYLIHLLKNLEKIDKSNSPKWVLNVASGPLRDLYEFFCGPNKGLIDFDCVDHDQEAVAYASELCEEFMDHINIHLANIFRFRIKKQYRLIWSAGLFDYLDDRKFRYLLKRLLPLLDKKNGELVIGNFSTYNPSRIYMELIGDWFLIHRSADELASLAIACGVSEKNFRIGKEPEGINSFLHIKTGKKFLPEPDI